MPWSSWWSADEPALVVVDADGPAAVPDVDAVGWMTPRKSTVVTTKATSTSTALTACNWRPRRRASPEGTCWLVGGLGHYPPACQPKGFGSKRFRLPATERTARRP